MAVLHRSRTRYRRKVTFQLESYGPTTDREALSVANQLIMSRSILTQNGLSWAQHIRVGKRRRL